MTQTAQNIQALLFVAGEAVPKNELLQLIQDDELETYIEELRTALAGSGLALVETATTLHLTTSPEVSSFLQQFQSEEPRELSKAAAETLAIIAYRGPIARYEIDMIRGVDCRSMVRQLVRRGIVARIRSAGKTVQYDITDDALRQLNITRREELPEFERLSKIE